MTRAGFDMALAGAAAMLLLSNGHVVPLDVDRWAGPACCGDAWLLDRCTGPTLDLGCGPGRLLAALAARDVTALGVDHSATAARQCRRRRVPMVRRNLFAPLPDEGRWRHVLLADGNIGIGGDPARLLARATRLLAPGGTLLVETTPEPDTFWRGTARLRTSAGAGRPMPWACAGSAAVVAIGRELGLTATAVDEGARGFVELTH